MIAYLEGTVIFKETGSFILNVNSVGYKVYSVGFDALTGDKLAIFIYDHIREDRRDLYGFTDRGALELFQRLIDISGVGTKLAQKILAVGPFEVILRNITNGDLEFLTSISGVGKKTAQKIILELKGVLVEEEVRTEDGDTIDALMSLGYTRADCLVIVKDLSGGTVEDKIKEALKILGSNI